MKGAGAESKAMVMAVIVRVASRPAVPHPGWDWTQPAQRLDRIPSANICVCER